MLAHAEDENYSQYRPVEKPRRDWRRKANSAPIRGRFGNELVARKRRIHRGASVSYVLAVLSAAPRLKREWNHRERLKLQNAARAALPDHRVAACLRHSLGTSGVAVTATGAGRTRLGGVMICDAHHVCPVCHSKKMAQDQHLGQQVVGRHYAGGGFTVDAVLTVPHGHDDRLADSLGRIDEVWAALRSKPVWHQLVRDLGVVGYVRRLEVTMTKNGWHPHFHTSFLCDWRAAEEVRGRSRAAVLADVHALMAGAWADAGRRLGMAVSLHAQAAVALVDASDGAKAVTYNTKNFGYGAGKRDSLTPFDLLRAVDQCADTVIVHAAKRLFAEYAEAIKGKHTLSFGGSARAAKGDASKPFIEEATPVSEDRLGIIASVAWKAVIKAGLRETTAQVTTRGELAATVLLAALWAGHATTPSGWLMLVESKTVIEVKSGLAPPAAMACSPA